MFYNEPNVFKMSESRSMYYLQTLGFYENPNRLTTALQYLYPPSCENPPLLPSGRPEGYPPFPLLPPDG